MLPIKKRFGTQRTLPHADKGGMTMDDKAFRRKLTFVMLVVLILCGGNAIGIITAALIWKFTGAVAGAILTAVVITLVALLCAIALILHHNRRAK